MSVPKEKNGIHDGRQDIATVIAVGAPVRLSQCNATCHVASVVHVRGLSMLSRWLS
jgi:hypothetical protein